MYRSEKRLYLTADRSRVVEEGDLSAAFLLCPEGGEIPDDEAERLGLVTTKAVEQAPSNKARSAASKKDG